MADIDDFDLDRSTAQAWREFQDRLSDVISVIDDSGDLTISTASEGDQAGPFVRFSCPRRDWIRGEAASNASLSQSFRLSAEQVVAMEELGWAPPAADGAPGTPNFSVELPQEGSDRLSELAVTALRDVYGVQHPVFLAPDQLAEVLQPPPPVEEPALPVPGRDLQRRRGSAVEVAPEDLTSTMPRDRDHLDDLVDAELTEMFGHPPIRDEEGDVAIRVGSTMLFLRTAADGHDVVVFAAVVHDIAGRSRAAEVLNDLNVEARWVKFQLVRDRVFAGVSVLARPFVPAHLAQAVRVMADVADGIDEELATKLEGRTTFTDGDQPG